MDDVGQLRVISALRARQRRASRLLKADSEYQRLRAAALRADDELAAATAESRNSRTMLAERRQLILSTDDAWRALDARVLAVEKARRRS
jgi:hypothetical protein